MLLSSTGRACTHLASRHRRQYATSNVNVHCQGPMARALPQASHALGIWRRGGPCTRLSPTELPHVVSSVAVEASSATAFEELSAGTARKYVLLTGKGGVGKTSLAASLAVKLAAAGHTTLVVSTDPAHSLSDSLAQDVSGGKPVPLQGTDLPLWGMEIDPEEAKKEFLAFSSSQKTGTQVEDFMKGMGLGLIADQLADLKLGELLDTPPPGLDEAVAIAKVVEFVQGASYAKFTRIIFDTAPTGHTLRLLTVPDFVEASLGKIIRLRKKLGSATAAVRSLFGTDEQDEAVEKLEKLQASVRLVRDLFRDQESTELVIATIPTVLGINESSRLLTALRKEKIPCKRIVVNQVLGENQGEAYLRMKLKDQERSLQLLEDDPQLAGLITIKAPLLDLEVRGVPALSYFGNTVWRDVFDEMNQPPAASTSSSSSSGARGGKASRGSSSSSSSRDRRYFLLGGKGGVGKTSSAASLAVKFANEGQPTLVVSTDPAHSLSDVFDQDLTGGRPVSVSNPLGSAFPLWGMEIDPELAREELRSVSGRESAQKFNDFLDNLGMGMLADQLKDLQLGELLDTPPPGVDEAVAISKVVQFLKNEEYAKFTRIIFDTAPTGHTLRLLALPDFLDATIGKLARLRQKLTQATGAVKSFFTGKEAEPDEALEKLEELKGRMQEARDLFHNQAATQFVIVTIPTVMATSESARLATALRAEGIPLKTIVVNQVVQASAGEKFLAARRKDQHQAMDRLRRDPGLAQLQVIEGPLFDLEVRGVPALQYFGSIVWK